MSNKLLYQKSYFENNLSTLLFLILFPFFFSALSILLSSFYLHVILSFYVFLSFHCFFHFPFLCFIKFSLSISILCHNILFLFHLCSNFHSYSIHKCHSHDLPSSLSHSLFSSCSCSFLLFILFHLFVCSFV